MLHAVVGVRALSSFLPGRIHHHRAYRRIGRGQSDTGAGQVERAAHVMEFVVQVALVPGVFFNFGDSGSAAASRWTTDRRRFVRVWIFGFRLRSEKASQPIEHALQIRG